MKITVLILTSGTKDRHIFIESLFKSLAKQTIKPDEIIVATETGGENLVKLVGKHLSNMSLTNLKVLETGYWNKCWTANKAILESRGDVIFLPEDDLYLTPRFIEEVINAFKEYPKAGCIYTNCIWVFQEGIKSKGGLAGWLARRLSKLTIHESILPRLARKINDHLIEIPVFTMSVACRKKALLRAKLYDMSVKEPILGEDYDLALRIRKAGYKIIQTKRAISYHLTMQVTKNTIKYSRDPAKLMRAYETEVYFMAKNRDVLGTSNVVKHAVYRAIEALAWGIRAKSLRAILYGVTGSIKGFIKGYLYGL